MREFVSHFLWDRWDPIGVNDDEAYRDEYETYVPMVVTLIKLDKSVEEIAEYLRGIEADQMGFEATCAPVKLVEDLLSGIRRLD